MDDVRAIMYRWAGVDGLTGDERGPNIDARELGFLEALMGQDFRQTGSAGQSDPGFLAGQDLQEAFHIAHQNIFARLAAQSIGAELFEGDFYYNIATDSFEGITGLNESTIDALETLGLGATYADVFWANVVRVPRDFAPTRRAGAQQARRREAQGRNTYNVLPFRRAERAANDNSAAQRTSAELPREIGCVYTTKQAGLKRNHEH